LDLPRLRQVGIAFGSPYRHDPGQVHHFCFLIRNRVQVVENRQGYAGSNKLAPVEANPVRKAHLLQALLLSERGLNPEVRRAPALRADAVKVRRAAYAASERSDEALTASSTAQR
jgi:hypothetical protein